MSLKPVSTVTFSCLAPKPTAWVIPTRFPTSASASSCPRPRSSPFLPLRAFRSIAACPWWGGEEVGLRVGCRPQKKGNPRAEAGRPVDVFHGQGDKMKQSTRSGWETGFGHRVIREKWAQKSHLLAVTHPGASNILAGSVELTTVCYVVQGATYLEFFFHSIRLSYWKNTPKPFLFMGLAHAVLTFPSDGWSRPLFTFHPQGHLLGCFPRLSSFTSLSVSLWLPVFAPWEFCSESWIHLHVFRTGPHVEEASSLLIDCTNPHRPAWSWGSPQVHKCLLTNARANPRNSILTAGYFWVRMLLLWDVCVSAFLDLGDSIHLCCHLFCHFKVQENHGRWF